jgi:hypothetical protein
VKIRTRLIFFGAVCAVVLAAAIAYAVRSRNAESAAARDAAQVANTSLGGVVGPRIVFRNMAPGPSYGMVATVPLNGPAGPRALTDTSCARVYATARNLVCLYANRGLVTTTYGARILNNKMRPTQQLPFVGVPSRARLSPDGSYAASTSFTSSVDSYGSVAFSTRTFITKVGGESLGTLEGFSLIQDGASIAPVDRNYWGVTFAPDDNTFYATVEWAHHTWLVRGSISQRKVVTLHEDAECPSLSPDGKNIVFKQRGDLPLGKWRLVDYNIASGRVTPLAETRSVDDQVEWLDNTHVLYALPRGGTHPEVDDIWSVPTSGTGQPKLLIPQASSPAVIR